MKVVGLLFFALVAVFAFATTGAFFAMIGLGMLHSGIAAVPALGFFPVLGGLWVLGAAGGALRGARKSGGDE